ncbi:MAG: hypothetical protein AAF533_17325 [Acidobacteriota bacterium]
MSRESFKVTSLILGLALVATPASAYVVVTWDNQVYEVPTLPEVRGTMVYFTLDETPVSLRVQDVNIVKTNEFNQALELGASPWEVARQARALPVASPEDHRLIVSQPLAVKGVTDADPETPDYRLLKDNERQGPRKSFSDSPGARRAPATKTPWPRSDRSSFGDAPGRARATEREESRDRFAREAERAYEEARRDSRRDDGPVEDEWTGPSAADLADIERIDSELAREQAYLRSLTAGEESVDDLDREIDSTMERIRKLQQNRDRLQSGRSRVQADDSSDWDESPRRSRRRREDVREREVPTSRTAKIERQIEEYRARLSHYRDQQANLPAGSSQDREIVDERIGELEYRIEKLERKLARAYDR